MRPTGAPGRWRRSGRFSQATIGRIWRAFGLQPHRRESFKPSRDFLAWTKTADETLAKVAKFCRRTLGPGH